LKLAGVWRLYRAAMTSVAGEVVYLDAPLNTHRRHDGGVTARLEPGAHAAEIARAQAVAAELLGLDDKARAAQAADLSKVAATLKAAPPRAARRRPRLPDGVRSD
jgi:hypothetical protein